MLKTPEFIGKYEELKKTCADKIVFGSADRDAPLSGIVEKLEGYKQFLNQIKAGKAKTKLIQVFYLI